ncbi:MAG: hypothetical protein WC862_00870 [Patescibacteria group bacterium]
MNQTSDPTIKDVLQELKENREIIEFIRDNAATKDDIADIRREMATKDDIADIRREMATKDDLRLVKTELRQEIQDAKNEMLTHVDAFVGLYQKHEQELAAVVARVNRFEEKLNAVIKHLGLQLETA